MQLSTRQIQIDRVADRMTEGTEAQVIANYKRSLKTARQQLAEIYEKYETGGSLTIQEMNKYDRLQSLFQTIDKELYSLTGKNATLTKKLSANIFQESYYRTGFALEEAVQAKLNFTVLNPKVIQASVENPIAGLTLNQTLQKNRAAIVSAVKSTITQGLVLGESYGPMSKRLTSTFEGDAVKARRVVRTEAHRNAQAGSLAASEHANDLGVEMEMMWQSTIDDRTRGQHQLMDGKLAVNLSTPGSRGERWQFTLPDGITAPAPGMSGYAHHDVNCRCSKRSFIKGFEPSVRRIRGEGVVPYKTYAEWAEEKGIPMKYKYPEPKIVEKPQQVPFKKLDDKLANRLYADKQVPGAYMDGKGWTKFENNLNEFTAGPSNIPDITQKLFQGDPNPPSYYVEDLQFSRDLIGALGNAPLKRTPLYRIEEAGKYNDFKPGDNFMMGTRSFTKDKSFVEGSIKGKFDVDYDSPVVFEVIGNSRSLNVQGYSVFKEQAESITGGSFRVLNVTQEGNVKRIAIEQLQVPKIFEMTPQVVGPKTPETIMDAIWGRNKAKELLKTATINEPEITDLMKTLAANNKVTLHGLDFKLKSEDSLTRKLRSDYQEAKWIATKEQIGDGVGDAVRYTVMSDEAGYISAVDDIYNQLVNAGYKPYKFKNYWDPDFDGSDLYHGINSNWVSPTGQQLELQFHTPTSFDIKEHKSHIIYERKRVSVDPVFRDARDQELRDLWSTVPVPSGARTFKPTIKTVKPSVDDVLTIDKVKNYDDLAKYAKKTYNLDLADDLKDLEFASIKEAFHGIDDTIKTFPQIKEHFTGFTTGKSGIMSCNVNGRISVSPPYFKPGKLYPQSSGRWSPEGVDSFYGAGAHETGHLVEVAILRKKYALESRYLVQMDWIDCTTAKKITSEAAKRVKKIRKQLGLPAKTNADLYRSVSQYAMKTRSETVAEAVADYMVNKEKARQMSRSIVEVLKEMLE